MRSHTRMKPLVLKQNLIQKNYKQSRTNPTAHLPSILAGLLNRVNRCTFADHVQGLLTYRQHTTTLEQADRACHLFHSIWQPTRSQETPHAQQPSLGIHTSARLSHSVTEGSLLAQKNLHTVAQLLEVNELTGHLTFDEKRALMEEFIPFPLLLYSSNRLLVRLHRNRPTKFVCKLLLPSLSSRWIETLAKYSRNSKETCSLLLMQLCSVMGSHYHSLMPTRSSLYRCCHLRQRDHLPDPEQNNMDTK